MEELSPESFSDRIDQGRLPPPSQRGLRWEYGLFDIIPRWEFEPDIEVVRHIGLIHLPPRAHYAVSKFAEGAFNKLFLFSPSLDMGDPSRESSVVEYIMRVALPIDPYFKTATEVATLKFLERRTFMPVPRVVAYDASSQNELQFEWIIMTRLPGVQLKEAWTSMPWDQKISVVAQLREHLDELHKPRFKKAGSLYLANEPHAPLHWKFTSNHGRDFIPLEDNPDFAIGPISALPFCYANRIKVPSDRGPFSDSSQMVKALLNIEMTSALDRKATLAVAIEQGDNEYDVEDLEELDETVDASKILLSLVDEFFNDVEDEEFVLHHDDLSAANILVDPKTLEITGIVDWECTSLQPLWTAIYFPQFLDGPEINNANLRLNFGVEVPTDLSTPPPTLQELLGAREDVEDTELQQELRDNIEKMLLRRVFTKEERSGGESEKLRRVFMNKVLQVDSAITFRRVLSWAERVREGGDPLPQKDEEVLYFWSEQ
ncbi:hypothetical protein CVT26_010878 [Gymnopilus dilepis]|uniref:Aminoglycoside phosphotransferase domain-containing protein n=1 Tax=Gymnopilus dilepis TaxID=231916 RepID=A0A409VIU1_9AGAR|nr:hypothetical protein CVT26_010878 [Gymnopilus dilepis]